MAEPIVTRGPSVVRSFLRAAEELSPFVDLAGPDQGPGGPVGALLNIGQERARRNQYRLGTEQAAKALLAAMTGEMVTPPKEPSSGLFGLGATFSRAMSDLGTIASGIGHIPRLVVDEVQNLGEAPAQIGEALRELGQGDVGEAIEGLATARGVRFLPGAFVAEQVGRELQGEEGLETLGEHPLFTLLDVSPFARAVPATEAQKAAMRARGVPEWKVAGARASTEARRALTRGIDERFGISDFMRRRGIHPDVGEVMRHLSQRDREAGDAAIAQGAVLLDVSRRYGLDEADHAQLSRVAQGLTEPDETLRPNVARALPEVERLTAAVMEEISGPEKFIEVEDLISGEVDRYPLSIPEAEKVAVRRRQAQRVSEALEKATKRRHEADQLDTVMSSVRTMAADPANLTKEFAETIRELGGEVARTDKHRELIRTISERLPAQIAEWRTPRNRAAVDELVYRTMQMPAKHRFDHLQLRKPGVFETLSDRAQQLVDDPDGLIQPLFELAHDVGEPEMVKGIQNLVDVEQARIAKDSTDAGITAKVEPHQVFMRYLGRIQGKPMTEWSPAELGEVGRRLQRLFPDSSQEMNRTGRVMVTLATRISEARIHPAQALAVREGLERQRPTIVNEALEVSRRRIDHLQRQIKPQWGRVARDISEQLERAGRGKRRGKYPKGFGAARVVREGLSSFHKALDRGDPRRAGMAARKIDRALAKIDAELQPAYRRRIGVAEVDVPSLRAEWHQIAKTLGPAETLRRTLENPARATADWLGVLDRSFKAHQAVQEAIEELPPPPAMEPALQRHIFEEGIAKLRATETADIDVGAISENLIRGFDAEVAKRMNDPTNPQDYTTATANAIRAMRRSAGDEPLLMAFAVQDEVLDADLRFLHEGMLGPVSAPTREIMRQIREEATEHWRVLRATDGIGAGATYMPLIDVTRLRSSLRNQHRIHGAGLRTPVHERTRSKWLEPSVSHWGMQMHHLVLDHHQRLATERALVDVIERWGAYDGRPDGLTARSLTAEHLDLAGRSDHPGLSRADVAQDLLKEGWRQFDPYELFPGQKPKAQQAQRFSLGGKTYENVWLPDWAYRTIEQTYAKGPKSRWGATFDRATRMWRTAILPMAPRWHVNNLISQAFLLPLRTSPIHVVTEFGNALKMLRADGQSWRELVWEGKTSLDNRISQGVGTIPREVAMADVAAGLSHGRMAQRFLGSRGQTFNSWMEGLYNANGFVDNMGRAIAYLYGEKKALRKGASAPEAAQAGIDAAHKVLQDWDRMTPIERSLVRGIFPFYGWLSHIVRYVSTYPADHPVRAAFLANTTRVWDQDHTAEALPERFKDYLFFGDFDPRRGRTGVYIGGINPFTDVNSIFNLAGIMVGADTSPGAVTSQANPFIQSIMEMMGVSTLSGRAELYPDIEVDPETGRLAAKTPGIVGTLVGNLFPQIEGVRAAAIYGGLDLPILRSQEMRLLHRDNPDAFRQRMLSLFGVPFATRKVHLGEEMARAELARHAAQQTAWSKALRTGDFSEAREYPGLRPQIAALEQIQEQAPDLLAAFRPLPSPRR